MKDRTKPRHLVRQVAVLAVLIAPLGAGCRLAFDARGTAQNTYQGDESGATEEHVGDRQLARELVMEDVRTRRQEDGRLHVQFKLRSTKGNNLPIEWDLVWFDTSGFRIDTPRHWTPAALGGAAFETIARTAPTHEAAIFELAVRKPNTVR